MRIIIANNTSSYHEGSRAVMTTLLNRLSEQKHEIVAKISAKTYQETISSVGFDAIVVNGEGTLHHKKSNCWIFKALLKSQALEKQSYLVNTVWDSNNIDHEVSRAIGNLDGLVVREIASATSLSGFVESGSVTICPDFSFFAPLDDEAAFTDFKGGEVRGDWYLKRGLDMDQARVFFPQQLTLRPRQLTWSEMIRSLRTSSLYITGRHHGVYAACKARTPFVAYEHNCHKIRGLFEWAGVEIPIPKNWGEVLSAREWAYDNKPEYDRLFDFLECQLPWAGIC